MKSTRDSRKQAPPPPPPAEAIHQHLGSRVKHLRGGRGWSLEALANASGVSRSMLSQIEREETNPTLAVTMRIAQAFAITIGGAPRASCSQLPASSLRRWPALTPE